MLGKKLKYEEMYLDSGKFDLKRFEKSGDYHPFFGLIVIALFALYIIPGLYYTYELGGIFKIWVLDWYNNYNEQITLVIENYGEPIKFYTIRAIIVLIAVYLITLAISYIVVRLFSELAAVFLYGGMLVQIGFFAFLYYETTFEYNWIFLVIIAIEVLTLLIWFKKFKLAVRYMKMGGMAIWKEKKLLIPQIFQTLWIIFLSILHTATTFMVFYDSKLDTTTAQMQIGGRQVTITGGMLYAGYSVLFVILIFFVLYATIVVKMLMIHHWYRNGSLKVWKSLSMMNRRWRALIVYSFFSGIIHSIQFVYRVLKGEIKVTNILEAAKVTHDLTPDSTVSLDAEEGKTSKKDEKGKKKKIPLHERIWMGLNYFTLPSIAIEDKNFAPALWSSMKMTMKQIPDIYIKKAHVNKLFRAVQFVSAALCGIIGAFTGWFIALQWGIDKNIAISVSTTLFLWMGGSTSVLVLNDLNMCYITLMYIHTLDETYGKKGYSRYELEAKEKLEKKEKRKRRNKKKERDADKNSDEN